MVSIVTARVVFLVAIFAYGSNCNSSLFEYTGKVSRLPSLCCHFLVQKKYKLIGKIIIAAGVIIDYIGSLGIVGGVDHDNVTIPVGGDMSAFLLQILGVLFIFLGACFCYYRNEIRYLMVVLVLLSLWTLWGWVHAILNI